MIKARKRQKTQRKMRFARRGDAVIGSRFGAMPTIDMGGDPRRPDRLGDEMSRTYKDVKDAWLDDGTPDRTLDCSVLQAIADAVQVLDGDANAEQEQQAQTINAGAGSLLPVDVYMGLHDGFRRHDLFAGLEASDDQAVWLGRSEYPSVDEQLYGGIEPWRE